jgi:trehalose 6-phosphate phosphatase
MIENASPHRTGNLPAPPPAPHRNWALFLDVDGTLLDIAAHPSAVTVPPGLREHLALLEQVLDGALALVSGRPLDDLDRLFDPLRLPASGQHGGEWRPQPHLPREVVARRTIPERLRQAAESLRDLDPGIIVEQKSHALAVHYRHAPSLGPDIGARLEHALYGIEGLILLPGKLVWEVKDAAQSKGTAVERFMAEPRFAGRIPVFIGDDTTDVDGFRAVEAMGGMALPVGALIQPGRPGFTDAAAVRAWLAEFASSAAGADR